MHGTSFAFPTHRRDLPDLAATRYTKETGWDYGCTVDLSLVKPKADGDNTLDAESLRETVLSALRAQYGAVKLLAFPDGTTWKKPVINSTAVIEIDSKRMILKVLGGVLGDAYGLPASLSEDEEDPRGPLGHDQDVLGAGLDNVVRSCGYITDGGERIIAVLREYVDGVPLGQALKPDSLSPEQKHLALLDPVDVYLRAMRIFKAFEAIDFVVVDQEHDQSLHVGCPPGKTKPDIYLTDTNLFAHYEGRTPFGIEETVDYFFSRFFGPQALEEIKHRIALSS